MTTQIKSSSATTPKKKRVVKKKRNPPTGRVQKIKGAQYAALRDKMKGLEYIRQLELCSADLKTLQDALTVCKKKRLTKQDKTDLANLDLRIEGLKLELMVIKEKISLNIRRLKFVLPELRSVELTDPQGNNPLAALANVLKDSIDLANT